MHPDVELCEMEAEDVDSAPQCRKCPVCDALPAMRAEAPVEQLEILGEPRRSDESRSAHADLSS